MYSLAQSVKILHFKSARFFIIWYCFPEADEFNNGFKQNMKNLETTNKY